MALHDMANRWEKSKDVRDTNGNKLKVGWVYKTNDNQLYTYIRLESNFHLVWLVGGGHRAFDGRGDWTTKAYTPVCDLYPLMKAVYNKLLFGHVDGVVT